MLLPAFSPFLLFLRTRTADYVPYKKRLSGFGLAAFPLSFLIVPNCIFTICFPESKLVSLYCCQYFLTCSLFRRTDLVPQIAISLVAFPIASLLMFSSGFPCWACSPLYVCYSLPELTLIRLLPTFSRFVPVPKDWHGFAFIQRIGKLSGFLPCERFLFSLPARPGFSVSDHFKPDNVSFLQLPSGIPHFPCHLRQALLSVQKLIPASCYQWPFSLSLSLKTELSLSDYCKSKHVLISLLQVSSKLVPARESWFTTVLLTYNHLKNLFPLPCDSFIKSGFPAAQSTLSYDFGWSGFLFRLF